MLVDLGRVTFSFGAGLLRYYAWPPQNRIGWGFERRQKRQLNDRKNKEIVRQPAVGVADATPRTALALRGPFGTSTCAAVRGQQTYENRTCS